MAEGGGGEEDPVREEMISSFRAVTSATRQEALFFLESHSFAVDDAVHSFLDAIEEDNDESLAPQKNQQPPQSTTNPRRRPQRRSRDDDDDDYVWEAEEEGGEDEDDADDEEYVGPASIPVPRPVARRGRRPEKKKQKIEKKAAAASGSGSRGSGPNVRTLSDLRSSRAVDDDEEDEDDPEWSPEEEDDEGQETYTGGEKSGLLVRDPPIGRNNVDEIFNRARRSGAGRAAPQRQPGSSRSFSGTGRLLSDDAAQADLQQPEDVVHNIYLWNNGFTVNDGPLKRFDDPANAEFLKSMKNNECPEELLPADGKTEVQVKLIRRGGSCPEPARQQPAFQGSGRILNSEASDNPVPSSDTTGGLPNNDTAPAAICPTVDDSLPVTSLQIRFADGIRAVSRFNTSNTIADVRAFIDASRPGDSRDYSLQAGFPPKVLDDVTKTIEEAGVASSVLIQKL